MRSQESAANRAHKNDEPVLVTDQVMRMPAEINVIPVTQEISERFADKMQWNCGAAKGDVNRKMQYAGVMDFSHI
jgi:hypothetical protein